MNRTFSERKPKKVDTKNKENETIIRALYMYGRVPEQWELLNEIESQKRVINGMIDNEEQYCLEINRRNNIINELEKKIIRICETCYENRETARIEKWIKELKGSISNEQQ